MRTCGYIQICLTGFVFYFFAVTPMSFAQSPLISESRALMMDRSLNASGLRVQFQTRVGGAGSVRLFDQKGRAVGTIGPQGLFEVAVTVENLQRSVSPSGIDLERLFERSAEIQIIEGRKFVRVIAPFDLIDLRTGEYISRGRNWFISLDEFTPKHNMTPVGVISGSSLYEQDQLNFETFLLKNGVTGEPKRPSALPADRPLQLRARPPATGAGADLFKRIGDGYLSPPTCGCTQPSCRVTSHFGRRQGHFHDGTDIGGTFSTEVRAAADGCLVRKTIGYGGGWGNAVFLDHTGGDANLVTLYAHMSSMTKKAYGAQPICYQRGELIGVVGRTGAATGPHLHFGVYLKGRAINSKGVLLTYDDSTFNMNCSDLDEFNSLLKRESVAQLEDARTKIISKEPPKGAPPLK